MSGYYDDFLSGDDVKAEARATEPTTRPFDDADGMCPNCVTPWKCNGPHEPTTRQGTDCDAAAIKALQLVLRFAEAAWGDETVADIVEDTIVAIGRDGLDGAEAIVIAAEKDAAEADHD